MADAKRQWRFPVLSLVAAMACGGGDKSATADAAAAAAAAGDAAGATFFTGQTVVLREKDVEGFLAVMREFRRLGLETRGSAENPMSSVSAMATAWGANREAMAILRANDFDIPRFQQVMYSIVLAAAASEMDGADANAQASAAQLEAMKDQLPAAQYEAMKKTLEQAQQMAEAMSKQPEGNIELVKRFRDDLEALR